MVNAYIERKLNVANLRKEKINPFLHFEIDSIRISYELSLKNKSKHTKRIINETRKYMRISQ